MQQSMSLFIDAEVTALIGLACLGGLLWSVLFKFLERRALDRNALGASKNIEASINDCASAADASDCTAACAAAPVATALASSKVWKQRLVMSVIALLTLMQFGFQCLLGAKLERENNECDSDFADSSYCLEVKMFQRWHASASDDHAEDELPIVALTDGALGSDGAAAPAYAEFSVDAAAEVDVAATEQDQSKPVLLDDAAPDTATVEVRWADVASWTRPRSLRGKEAKGKAVMTKDELSQGKWAGALPKIACVAVVTSDHTDAEMKVFVAQFKAQDYEGQKQLILVYHREDLAAKKLAHHYIDYKNHSWVKAVGHMGEDNDAFSAATYRFGAWSSKEEIVARYDIGFYHHPARLSSQIRAMALSRRPASLLGAWSSTNSSDVGVFSAEYLGAPSLVGEAAWMEKYWFPRKDGEVDDLAKAEKHIVEVDAAELLAYKQREHA